MDAGGGRGRRQIRQTERRRLPNAPTLSLLTGPVAGTAAYSFSYPHWFLPLNGGRPPRPVTRTPPLSAVLQTLLDEGPNPTSFASPAADFVLRHGDSSGRGAPAGGSLRLALEALTRWPTTRIL